MTEPLADRQGQILVAIVREHIRTADPVGSKHLVGRFNLDVSSATVRNDMSRLEELGYLQQPHTSAGRIPTDLGYRFFVDHTPARLPSSSQRELEEAFGGRPAELAELLRRASEVLSRTTHLAAAATAPPLKQSRLKHLDCAWLGPRRGVVVVVADGGRVEKRVVEFGADIDEQALEEHSTALNHEIAGSTISDALSVVTARATGKKPGTAAVVAAAVREALGAFLDADQELVVGGTANLAGSDALAEAGALPRLFEVIERRIDLRQALSDAQPPASVTIGSENPIEDLQHCSLIVAPYLPGAAIAVIGPTRLEYPRVIAAVSLMAKLIGQAFDEMK